MTAKVHTIEIDESTARTLETRAAEKGVSVSQLIAELADAESKPVALDAETIVELDRRWKGVQAQGRIVSNEDVVRWLKTWGTSDFKPWHDR